MGHSSPATTRTSIALHFLNFLPKECKRNLQSKLVGKERGRTISWFGFHLRYALGGGDKTGRQPIAWNISLGRQQRNDVPPMPAIAAEMRVQCEHLAIGV